MQNVSPSTTGWEKEISDVISDTLFPDVLNNPVTRKRNMELLQFIVIIAVKHHLFLEFLFSEHELELLKESLQAYKAFLKLKGSRDGVNLCQAQCYNVTCRRICCGQNSTIKIRPDKKDSPATGPALPTPVNHAEPKRSEVKSEAKGNEEDGDESLPHFNF